MTRELDPRIASYLAKNREWAGSKDYKAPIPFKEMQKKGREREDGTIIVRESEATVVRTAGGRVHAAMSTLLVLSAVGNLGKKGVIMVVHHTDCGLQTAADEDIRKVLGEGIGEDGKEVLKGAVFGSFVRPEESVREDLEVLKTSPFFKGMQILGFVQDTETGLLTEVGALE